MILKLSVLLGYSIHQFLIVEAEHLLLTLQVSSLNGFQCDVQSPCTFVRPRDPDVRLSVVLSTTRRDLKQIRSLIENNIVRWLWTPNKQYRRMVMNWIDSLTRPRSYWHSPTLGEFIVPSIENLPSYGREHGVNVTWDLYTHKKVVVKQGWSGGRTQ